MIALALFLTMILAIVGGGGLCAYVECKYGNFAAWTTFVGVIVTSAVFLVAFVEEVSK